MAYTRINWQDGESGGTPLSAENLNIMDMQIEQNTNDIANIIESGSNETGEWIKYADGRLITTHKVTRTLSRTSPRGNMYETDQQADLGQYPVAFKETPYIFLTLYGQNAILEAVNNPTETNAGLVYLLAPTSNSSANYTIQVLAIGRWK